MGVATDESIHRFVHQQQHEHYKSSNLHLSLDYCLLPPEVAAPSTED